MPDSLKNIIIDAIQIQGGKLPFADFMQISLYNPDLGYYAAGATKIGQNGDFITAPTLSPLFSHCLAKQCQQVLSGLKQPAQSSDNHQHSKETHIENACNINNKGCTPKTPAEMATNSTSNADSKPIPTDILEFGAGTGQMAADILKYLKQENSLPDRYLIMEVSSELKDRQQKLLKAELPDYFDNIVWLDALPDEPINGVILANEVLDAMPVNCFEYCDGEYFERYVSYDGDNFVWTLGEPSSERLTNHLETLDLKSKIHTKHSSNIDAPDKKIGSLDQVYQSEVNLFIDGWINSLYDSLGTGAVLLIDYGYGRDEYYHPDRSTGTLMCHYQHQAHSDPLIHVGLQDITSHVDFTHVAEAADDAGFDIEGFTTQAGFLLSCGITSMIDHLDPGTKDYVQNTQAIHTLTSPSEMGEIFKVMALGKNLEDDLIGFTLMDRLSSL